MAAAVITINGAAVTPPSSSPDNALEWNCTWEERVDGVGQFSGVIQDRLLGSTEYGRGTIINDPGAGPAGANTSWGWRDLVNVTIGGNNAFYGEIVHSTLRLPVGHPYRRWSLQASDFNTILDTRLVGYPDGSDWETVDGGATHSPIDPFAKCSTTDAATVAALMAQYVELPRGMPITTFGTSTFVHSWLAPAALTDPATGLPRLTWTNTNLRAALDEVRSLAAFPIFCWIDPDLEVHWEALPDWSVISTGGLTLGLPATPFTREAPAILTDTSPNGTTSVGCRGLSIDYDSTYMPQQVYVSGVTDFVYNGGSTRYHGTGWPRRTSGRRDQLAGFRQIAVDAQTVTDAQKNSVSTANEQYARRARIRGTVTVGSPTEAVDGWRCGQLLRIYDDRLPATLRGVGFPIQRVKGTAKAGQDWVEYELEFGDFPIARFSAKYRNTPQRLQTARLPAKIHRIYWPTTHLRSSTAYVLTSQMVDHSHKPVRHAGVPVTWSLEVLDSAGASVGGGSLVALSNTTDQHGRTAATLTTGATTDRHYHVTATTAAQ